MQSTISHLHKTTQRAQDSNHKSQTETPLFGAELRPPRLLSFLLSLAQDSRCNCQVFQGRDIAGRGTGGPFSVPTGIFALRPRGYLSTRGPGPGAGSPGGRVRASDVSEIRGPKVRSAPSEVAKGAPRRQHPEVGVGKFPVDTDSPAAWFPAADS